MQGAVGIILFIIGILLCDKTDAENDAMDAAAVLLILFGMMAFILWLIEDGWVLVR